MEDADQWNYEVNQGAHEPAQIGSNMLAAFAAFPSFEQEILRLESNEMQIHKGYDL